MCSSTPTRATQNQYTSSYCICNMQHAIAMVEAGCPVFIPCCVLVCNEPHFFTLGVRFVGIPCPPLLLSRIDIGTLDLGLQQINFTNEINKSTYGYRSKRSQGISDAWTQILNLYLSIYLGALKVRDIRILIFYFNGMCALQHQRCLESKLKSYFLS